MGILNLGQIIINDPPSRYAESGLILTTDPFNENPWEERLSISASRDSALVIVPY